MLLIFPFVLFLNFFMSGDFMAMTLFSGSPGSGKSACATVDAIEHMLSGGIIALNFDLVENWHHLLAQSSYRVKWMRQDPEKVAQEYHSRVLKIGSAQSLYEASEILGRSAKRFKGRIVEGSGKIYIDEAQFFFNCREYKKNKDFIQFFTQHRKLGWDVIIVAHGQDFIDKQVRLLLEYLVTLRNLAKVRWLWGSVPLCRYPRFFANRYYGGVGAGSGLHIDWRIYSLYPRFADLYDSMQVFAFDELEPHCLPMGTFETKKKISLVGQSESWPRFYAPACASVSGAENLG